MNRLALIPEIELGLRPGDLVLHKTHGIGTVLEEWGSFNSCSSCSRLGGSAGGACRYCGHTTHLVSGTGIFDVRFECDGKTRSINQTWLKKEA